MPRAIDAQVSQLGRAGWGRWATPLPRWTAAGGTFPTLTPPPPPQSEVKPPRAARTSYVAGSLLQAAGQRQGARQGARLEENSQENKKSERAPATAGHGAGEA